MLRSASPTGMRLRPGSKVRGAVLATYSGSGGGWGNAWSNYSASGMRARLARLASIGVDTVEVQCTGIGVGVQAPGAPYANASGFYPPDSVLYPAVADFIAACRQYNMGIFFNFAGTASELFGADGSLAGSNLQNAFKTFRWFASLAPDLLRAVDACNELTNTPPSTWSSTSRRASDIQLVMSGIRATAPGLPVSFSIYCSSVGLFSSTGDNPFKLQSTMGCDFHIYHPYNGLAGSTSITPSQAPAGSDLAVLEAQPWFIGWHYMGECGLESENSDAARTAWFAGLGDQHRRARSLGGCAFSDQNFNGVGEVGHYGLFDTGGNPITAATTQVSLWPKAV